MVPDWGRRRVPSTTLAFNRDVGLLIGAGTVMERYGFLKTPYRTKVSLSAAYATRAGLPVLDYRHELKDVVPGRADLSFQARWSGIEVLHFHGFGNDTEVEGSREFHRVDQRLLTLAPAATISIGHSSTLTVGPRFTMSVTDTAAEEGSFLSLERPYGSGTFTQLGARAEARVETRDRGTASGSGWLVIAGGSYHPGILDSERGSFGEVNGAITTYLSATKEGNQTAALRLGGKKVLGTAPFYEAAFIGGLGTVRGLRAERFAGTGAAYANLELRTYLTQIRLIVPADFGVFGLMDAGRVFQSGESSRKWHTAVGGGLWIAPLQRANVFSLALARGSEGAALYLTSGFMY
jgi:outer membrane protein assembly factor BamA